MKAADISSDTFRFRVAANVPLEFFQSYPIPVIFNDHIALDFFFFPAQGLPPNQPILHTPMIRITVAFDNGKILRKGPVEPRDYGLDAPPGAKMGEHNLSHMSIDILDELEEILYTSLDQLLEVFPDLPKEPEEKYIIAANNFLFSFNQISHKPLQSFYENTNPLFFKWIRNHSIDPGKKLEQGDL